MVTDIQLQNSASDVISLGARENDYVLDFADWDVAKVSTSTIYYFPTEDCERILYHDWQPRSVLIIGWVIGADEEDIAVKCDRLNAFIGLQQEIKIFYNWFHLTFYPVKNVKFANTEQDNNEVLCKFQIEGICLDPIWHDDSIIDLTDSGEGKRIRPMFRFPLTINADIPSVVMGYPVQMLYKIINYQGSISRGIIIEIQSTDVIHDILIELEQNEIKYTFALTGVYPADTKIVIDTREGFHLATLDGADISADITADVAEKSQWLQMRPGINFFTLYYISDGLAEFTVIQEQYDNLFEVQT